MGGVCGCGCEVVGPVFHDGGGGERTPKIGGGGGRAPNTGGGGGGKGGGGEETAKVGGGGGLAPKEGGGLEHCSCGTLVLVNVCDVVDAATMPELQGMAK